MLTSILQTNAKIARYLKLDFWNTTTSQGATIKAATDFTMTQHLNTTDGDGPAWELYPSVLATSAAYGDPRGTYASFLAKADPKYTNMPYFLFNQVSTIKWQG